MTEFWEHSRLSIEKNTRAKDLYYQSKALPWWRIRERRRLYAEGLALHREAKQHLADMHKIIKQPR